MFDNHIFKFGLDDFEKSRQSCQNCASFSPDDEVEWVDDVENSCYNCRYRRWTANSFICMQRDN